MVSSGVPVLSDTVVSSPDAPAVVQPPPREEAAAEWTVSGLAAAIQASLEGQFGTVRVRGEVSGFKKHSSGHAWFALKDQDAVIDAVCWRGTLARSAVALADGMDIVASGRVTSWPQRSRYQIVVESFELTGEGSLLRLLEETKHRLRQEGLFDPARKKPLPFMPRSVGVITSPTGAVIQDIMHRLRERVPCHVTLWPAAVQGQGSVEQIVEALQGFSALPEEKRPQVVILARGGGSLEDLWGFNDERMVRAVAASRIPVISAVGHETDTTLVDYAADHRAPTPTAAAEMILPLKSVMLQKLGETHQRLNRRLDQMIEVRSLRVQRFQALLNTRRTMLDLPRQRLDDAWERASAAIRRLFEMRGQRLEQTAALLENCAWHRILQRGFTWAETAAGVPLTSAASVPEETPGRLHFHDGAVDVLFRPRTSGERAPSTPRSTPTPPRPSSGKEQTRLW
jgi:exodeoxyribonuclease VII large subunit